MPAYGIDTATLADGPQCSASGEFCFLCAYEGDDGGEGDVWQSVTDLIHDLVAAKREVPAIVSAVVKAYDQAVRPTLRYTHPDTGAVVVSPAWSHASVRRHLLFSRAFPALLDGTVTCMLHSIIVAYNKGLIDSHTGEPVEDKRRAFVDTIGALAKWEKHAERGAAPRAKLT